MLPGKRISRTSLILRVPGRDLFLRSLFDFTSSKMRFETKKNVLQKKHQKTRLVREIRLLRGRRTSLKIDAKLVRYGFLMRQNSLWDSLAVAKPFPRNQRKRFLLVIPVKFLIYV